MPSQHDINEEAIANACRLAGGWAPEIMGALPSRKELPFPAEHLFGLAWTESENSWAMMTLDEIMVMTGDKGKAAGPWQIHARYAEDAQDEWEDYCKMGPKPKRDGTLIEQASCVIWYVKAYSFQDFVALHHFGCNGYDPTRHDRLTWIQYRQRYETGRERWCRRWA